MFWGQLGDITFELRYTPDTISKNESENYAQHTIIDDRLYLQHIAKGETVINLSIILNRILLDEKPEDKYRELRQKKEEGEVLPFILGNGEILGDYVIIALAQSQVITDNTGDILSMTVDITLQEYDTYYKEVITF